MEFEKIALSALLCKFPLEGLGAIIAQAEGDAREADKSFFNDFRKVARWENAAFTESEMEALERLLEDDWLKSGDGWTDKKPAITRIGWMLLKFSNQLLAVGEGDYPVVRFEQLLRWRRLSLLVGEDLLSTAFMAGCSSQIDDDVPGHLDWPDVLRHDDKDINTLLKQGVADVHSHFFASGNIFEINWINLMNRISGITQMNEDEYLQFPDIGLKGNNRYYSYRNIIIAAAFLRYNLYKLLDNPNDEKIVDSLRESLSFLSDWSYCALNQSRMQAAINAEKFVAVKDNNRVAIDYALNKNYESPFGVLCGERALLYRYFKGLFRYNRYLQIASPYFYLYLLIKSKIRKEFIETNGLKGFKNFQTYQKRKRIFVRKTNEQVRYNRYIVQSSLAVSDNHYLESRISPDDVKTLWKSNLEQSLFWGRKSVAAFNDRLSIVVHFIKSNYKSKEEVEGEVRYSKTRLKAKAAMNQLLRDVASSRNVERVVGIDAAGDELQCRPEIFAHVFRYARSQGLCNQTYHVGEDFYDLVDGLRAIDECIRFMEFDKKCRLGHVLALGINAEEYYKTRQFRMILPKQNYLDNLIWLYQTIRKYDVAVPQSLLLFIEEKAYELYSQVGYQQAFNIQSYWHSMLLRGNELDSVSEETDDLQMSAWEKTACCKAEEVRVASRDKQARSLFRQYLTESSVKKNGEISVSEKWMHSIAEVLTHIQDKMIEDIAKRKIAVECNPSSNVSIGPFCRYDEHPVFRFMPYDKKSVDAPCLCVSVNTDDRGVFQTSIENEYALIAIALRKKNVRDDEILQYLEKLQKNSIKQLFEPVELRRRLL